MSAYYSSLIPGFRQEQLLSFFLNDYRIRSFPLLEIQKTLVCSKYPGISPNLFRIYQFWCIYIDEGRLFRIWIAPMNFKSVLIINEHYVFRDQTESMLRSAMKKELFISCLHKCKIWAINDVWFAVHTYIIGT